jgi:hypothetical protein
VRVDLEDVLDSSIGRRNQQLRACRIERQEGHRLIDTGLGGALWMMEMGL